MSILLRISLSTDWPAELRRMFPRITVSQVEAFGALAAQDGLIGDDGEPAPALMAWCEEVAAT